MASIAALVLGASNVLVQVIIAILLAAGLEPAVAWLREKIRDHQAAEGAPASQPVR